MLDGEFDIRPYNHTSTYCIIRHTNNDAYIKTADWFMGELPQSRRLLQISFSWILLSLRERDRDKKMTVYEACRGGRLRERQNKAELHTPKTVTHTHTQVTKAH